MSTPKQINERLVQIECIDGKTLTGRLQLPTDSTLTKYLNQNVTFLVIKTDLGRTLIVNKQHILRLEPQEQRQQSSVENIREDI